MNRTVTTNSQVDFGNSALGWRYKLSIWKGMPVHRLFDMSRERIRIYQRRNGSVKVLVLRSTTVPSPEVAQRLAEANIRWNRIDDGLSLSRIYPEHFFRQPLRDELLSLTELDCIPVAWGGENFFDGLAQLPEPLMLPESGDEVQDGV